VHELLDLLVSDLVGATRERLANAAPPSAAAVLTRQTPLVAVSASLAEEQGELERLLFARVYRHPAVLDQRAHACHALGGLFDRVLAEPHRLPEQYAAIARSEGLPRAVADYLSGMTDRSAWEEYARLEGPGGQDWNTAPGW
jgi:dGTPase